MILRVPVIACAKCRKPVDEVQVETGDSHYHFFVKCHGAQDECTVSIAWYHDNGPYVVEAVAFKE